MTICRHVSVHGHSVRDMILHNEKGEGIRAIFDAEKTADPYICSSRAHELDMQRDAHISTTDLKRYT